MLKPGQAAPGTTDESGIELSGSGRSSGSDRDSDRHSDCSHSPKTNRKDRVRAPSSASESEIEIAKLVFKQLFRILFIMSSTDFIQSK